MSTEAPILGELNSPMERQLHRARASVNRLKDIILSKGTGCSMISC